MHQSAAKSPSQQGCSLSTIFSKKEQFVTSSNSTFVVRRDHAKNICRQARTCEKAKRRERTDAKRGKIEGYAVHQGRSWTDKEFNALQMWNQHRTDTMQCTLQNEQGWISPRRRREGLNDPTFCWIAFRLPTQAALYLPPLRVKRILLEHHSVSQQTGASSKTALILDLKLLPAEHREEKESKSGQVYP